MSASNHASMSPMQRLLELEKRINSLMDSQSVCETNNDLPRSSLERKLIWMGGEHLLLRCLKRNPIALTAYRLPAEMNVDRQNNVEILLSNHGRGLELIELESGDAVLLTDKTSMMPSKAILHALYEDDEDKITFPSAIEILSLPYFMPIERGRRWSMFAKGLLSAYPIDSSRKKNQNIRTQQQEELLKKLGATVQSQSVEIASLRSELSSVNRRINELLAIQQYHKKDNRRSSER